MSEALATAPLHLTCESCGAALTVAPERRTTVCPYCAAPAVIERPAGDGAEDPVFTVPFVVPEARARALAAAWVHRRRLFTPSAFAKAKVGDVRGVYLPVWLYGATAHTEYEVEIGEDYESRGADGKDHVHTEWLKFSGSHATYVHDVLVTASKGVPDDELEKVEPFDLGALRRYRPELIAGWIAEDPSVVRAASLGRAQDEAKAQVVGQLGHYLPGDHQRDLRIGVRFDDEDLSLVLVPVWVLAVRWRQDKKPVRLLINGQSGEAAGKVPLSPLKILIASVLGLGVLAAAAAYLWPLLQ